MIHHLPHEAPVRGERVGAGHVHRAGPRAVHSGRVGAAVKRPKLRPTDEQALRAELQALADAGTVTVPKGPVRIAYVTLGTAPVGDGDGGMY